MLFGPYRLASLGRRLGPLVLASGLTAGSLAGLAATPANADTCGDSCVVVPGTVQTPLGLVTVTASAANVVTVHLDPTTPNTLVFGIPFQIPPGPPCRPDYCRTTIDTTGGLVIIDEFQMPPGPPSRFALPNLVIISIHPPGPCRAHTSGTTVVFTPITPPGPPN